MKPTEEDQALKMISDSLSWESLDAVPQSEITQLQGRIVSALTAVREKTIKRAIVVVKDKHSIAYAPFSKTELINTTIHQLEAIRAGDKE